MTTPYTGTVVPADNFIITPPANAYVNDAGEIVMDLSGSPGGPVVATTLSATGAVTFDDTLAVAGASALHATGITGALTVSSTLGVTGASTLAATSATALTASTSLTVTGASIVGLTEPVSFPASNIRAASAGVYGTAAPFAGTIVKVYTFLNSILATGDAVLTLSINGVAVTNGVVTIAEAGSAVGVVDSATPTALNTVAEGDSIAITVSGANTQNPSSAQVVVVIRRSA